MPLSFVQKKITTEIRESEDSRYYLMIKVRDCSARQCSPILFRRLTLSHSSNLAFKASVSS